MRGAREGKQYDWSGSRILRHTVIPSKRGVIGSEDVLIPTDLREWITPPDSQVIKQALDKMNLPDTKEEGDFDRRAVKIWEHVARKIAYTPDEVAQRKIDFWQFPPETLALGKGDCEDCAYLVASLLLGSGISPFCVRVVFGTVRCEGGPPTGHAWPIYKNEAGVWVILDTACDVLPKTPYLADDLVRKGSDPRYEPDICLNQYHVWTVGRGRRIRKVESYLRSRGWLPRT